ncbi:helix-turn-helix domain-containing protein [Streptosporangium sp. NPDC002721]|uniref:helix-turn-helix domain-containing protein n=1 Tax=Streptosporangium sp. NPDC002721 TaxID=3366188 RepID=UPI0036BFD953
MIDAETLGRRIAEARGRAGLTQAELAALIPLDRSALAKIEGGDRRISALELAKLSDVIGVRIEWFIQDAPAAIVSRRNAQEPGTPSPKIDLMVERLTRAVEFVAEQAEHFVLPVTPSKKMPTTNAQAEKLASDTRALLGVDGDGPIVGLDEKAASIGLLVFSYDLGTDTADAATVLLRSGGVAIINGQRRVGRRRLALAHEFGHYLVADEYTVDWRIAEQQSVEQREGLFDRFARALLLPRMSIERDWKKLVADSEGELRTAAVRIASLYRVDMTTLARRLNELGLISHGEAGKVRLIRTTRADIVDFDLVVAKDELIPPSLPRNYERAVLGLYRSEVISADRALDLLFDTWDESMLPPLPRRSEGAIWQYV